MHFHPNPSSLVVTMIRYASSTTVVCRPLGSLTLTAWTYEYSFSFAPSSSLRLRLMRTRRRYGTPLMPASQTFLLSWGSRRTSVVPWNVLARQLYNVLSQPAAIALREICQLQQGLDLP